MLTTQRKLKCQLTDKVTPNRVNGLHSMPKYPISCQFRYCILLVIKYTPTQRIILDAWKINWLAWCRVPVTLLRMRETYGKRMKINEIIFIRTKLQKSLELIEMPAYKYRTSGVPLYRLWGVFSVCLEYACRINRPRIRPNTHKIFKHA